MLHLERQTVTCKGPCLQSVPEKGCVTPPPVPGQCSFPRENATILCESWRRCAALNCNSFRQDCQARSRSHKLEHSFGDAYAYTRTPVRYRNNERKAYHRRFDTDYFLYDAMHIYRTYFMNYQRGFFVESGAIDGSVYGSNSYYFERYLGWEGLLVEASAQNYRRLRYRRSETPGVHAVRTALCSFNGWTKFPSTGGCCGATGKGDERVPCTRMQSLLHTHNASRIDFWSLDVEGGEMDVLMGVDWRVPIYVILIESVTPEIRMLLRRRGFDHRPFDSPSRLNEIWVNDAHRLP